MPAIRRQESPVRSISGAGDGDAEPVAQLGGTFSATALSQRLMNTDATELDPRIKTGSNAALDTAQIGFR